MDNDSNWSGYLRIHKGLEQKIKEKRKRCREELMAKVNNKYKKNIKNFWQIVNGSIKSRVKI